jgi:hypothetical protein
MKKTKEWKNEFPSDAVIEAESRRYKMCNEFLKRIEGVVKALPNIDFELLCKMLQWGEPKASELELSLALKYLSDPPRGLTLSKGRFGYFHPSYFDKK